MKVEDCITESLAYERAWTRVASLIATVREEKKKSDAEQAAADQGQDESWNIVMDGLKSLKDEYYKESARIWRMAEKKSELYDWALQDMLSSVIVTAAEDYEIALSGVRNEDEVLRIEQFAEILGDQIVNIMDRIKKNQAEFVKVVRRDAKEIIKETKRNRQLEIVMNLNVHKCPNCGGGLYSKKEHGVTRICCARCQLFEIIKDGDIRK